jgi:hypothetical protein
MKFASKVLRAIRKVMRPNSGIQTKHRHARRRALFVEGLENRRVLATGDLLISEFMANPTGNDVATEYVELIATRTINFATTNYSVIWTQNGVATASGWAAGGTITYGFNLTSGIVNAGDIFYVGGVDMAPTGTKLRTIDPSMQFTGDDGLGISSPTGGNLGNGGPAADSIAVFDMRISSVTSSTVPIDAIFYDSDADPGTAVVLAGAAGYELPVNDRYSGGKLQSTSFLALNPVEGSATIATGTYNAATNTFLTTRVWTNGAATAASAVTLSPAVVASPADSLITYGSNTTFTASASGNPSPSIQWQISVDAGTNWSNLVNGGVYSGVTSGTLTLTKPPVSFSNNQYRARFTNLGGTVESNSATLTVNQKALTATAAVDDKIYDGTTDATVTITLIGTVVGDDVDGTATGTFDTKHVAAVKPVAISAITLSGADAANYTVGSAPAATADITPLEITVTAAAASRAWINGSVASDGVPTISPPIPPGSGDVPSFTQTYDNPDVGTDKLLTPSGSINDGNGGGNYLITFASANTGTITPTGDAPILEDVGINLGVVGLTAAQRSQIVSLTVEFNNTITLDAGAFSIENTGLYTENSPGSVMVNSSFIKYTPGTGSVFIITFDAGAGANGSTSGGVVRRAGALGTSRGDSLADGNFVLTVDPTKVHQVDGQVISDNQFGDDYDADDFFRMFGDGDGDGDVDGSDTIKFRQALTSYNAAFDWDGGNQVKNGSVDSTNFAANNGKKRRQ